MQSFRDDVNADDIKALENRDMKDTSVKPEFIAGVDANAEYVGSTGVPDATTVNEINPNQEY